MPESEPQQPTAPPAEGRPSAVSADAADAGEAARPRRGKRSRKQALARRMERAAIAAAVQAAEAKVRRPPPTSPLGQAVLAGLTLLTIGVAVVGSYFVFEQWPKENQALNLAGDVQAQVAEFERLQLRIDLEHNVLQHTLQHGEPATDGDTDDETAEPAQEQEAADAAGSALPTIRQSMTSLADLMRDAYACLRKARRLAQVHADKFGPDAMGHDMIRSSLTRLAEAEPAFLERARTIDALSRDLAIPLGSAARADRDEASVAE